MTPTNYNSLKEDSSVDLQPYRVKSVKNDEIIRPQVLTNTMHEAQFLIKCLFRYHGKVLFD